jgi:hypothetical protein
MSFELCMRPSKGGGMSRWPERVTGSFRWSEGKGVEWFGKLGHRIVLLG